MAVIMVMRMAAAIVRSFLLQDVEEVLHFQDAVIGQVGAVHSVFALVSSENCAEGLGADCFGHFGVVRAAELAQGWHNVFLADLHGDAGTVGEFLDQLAVLGHHSLVNFQEFLSGGCGTSAEGRSSQNISAALTSKPEESTASSTWPT